MKKKEYWDKQTTKTQLKNFISKAKNICSFMFIYITLIFAELAYFSLSFLSISPESIWSIVIRSMPACFLSLTYICCLNISISYDIGTSHITELVGRLSSLVAKYSRLVVQPLPVTPLPLFLTDRLHSAG